MNPSHSVFVRAFVTAGFCLLATLDPASGLPGEEKPVSILAARIGGHVHPSLCRTNHGTLIVVYKGANVLMVSRSVDRGDTWSKPEPIATSAMRPGVIRKVEKFEVYPGTVDLLPGGRVLVTWNYIADDKARDGYYERALLYTVSEDDGLSWSEQKLIGPIAGKHLGAVRHNVLPLPDGRWLLPLRVGPPRVFDPRNGELTEFPVIGPDGKQHEFQQIVRTATGALLAMGPVMLHSGDEGGSWSRIEGFPAIPDKRDNAEGRFLTPLTDGRVLVTWGIGHDNKGLRYQLSRDDGKTWDKEGAVILLPETSIAARYYSARTVQIDGVHIGTVFMNPEGVHFLKVRLDRLTRATGSGAGNDDGSRLDDVVFTAECDGTSQRMVRILPANFDPGIPIDVLIALHGHGSDRWQFVRDKRGECRAVRDVARQNGMILVSPDYRAKTSWMGPKAEADLVQIISELKRRHSVRRVFLVGASMGGASCLTFAALHPKLVDGVVSMNGTANHVEYDRFQEAISASFGGSKSEVPNEYRKRSAEFFPDRFTMPVAFTVGGNDTSVPPQSVLRLAGKLEQAGRKVLRIHRKTGGHSTTYEDACAAMEFILKVAVPDPE